MDALKALEMIEKLERDLVDLYEMLHDRYRADSALSSFFYQLKMEEVDHANMASMQVRIVRSKPADFGEVEFNFTDFKQVMDAMAIVRSMPADRVKETLMQCYLIESSPVEHYVLSALRSTNEDIRQLLDMLGQGFRDHLAFFAARIKALGVDISSLETVRRHPRVVLSARAVINNKIYAKTVDVSESGIFLLTAGAFSEGLQVVVSFPVGKETVNVRGVVRYVVPKAGIAVAFTDLPEQERALISKFVDSVIASHVPATDRT